MYTSLEVSLSGDSGKEVLEFGDEGGDGDSRRMDVDWYCEYTDIVKDKRSLIGKLMSSSSQSHSDPALNITGLMRSLAPHLIVK
jgi:hypothetical protein